MTTISSQIIQNSNMSATSSASSSANADKTGSSSSVSSYDFLKLMTMQLQYQDPTNPMDNTDMLAQEAQFSTLEQMEALTSAFTSFSNAYQANNLMGQLVEITDSSGNIETGYVEYVNLNEKNGASVYMNGKLRPLSQVTKVYPANTVVTDQINSNTSSIKDGISSLGDTISNLADKIGEYINKDKIEQQVKEVLD